MNSIASITLEVADTTAANSFYKEAFGLGDLLRFRESDAPTSGFRGYTLSLVVSQPADVDALVEAAVGAGATTLKPATRSFWGYGGSVRAPDGAIWTIASSSKKNVGPPTGKVDEVVLLLGPADVAASKRFYVDQGFAVGKSFARTYVEFDSPGSPVKLALNKRKSLARNAGVAPEGTGSHRLVIGCDSASFTDPDGFVWEASGGGLGD